jgi:hypothetical protein
MGVFNTQLLEKDRKKLKSHVHITVPLLNAFHRSDFAN